MRRVHVNPGRRHLQKGGKIIPTRRHRETGIMAVEEMLGELSWRVLSRCRTYRASPTL